MHARIKYLPIRERRSARPSKIDPLTYRFPSWIKQRFFGEGPVFRRAAQRAAVGVSALFTVTQIGSISGISGTPRVSATSAARGRRI